MYYGEQHSNFSSNNNNNNTEETEQLLHDAFEELEKERAMRVDLEAQVKALQEKQESSKAGKKKRRSSSRSTISGSAAASLTVAAAATSANNNEEIPTAVSHSSPSSSATSIKHYQALQQEIEGYRQIVDALTSERPAIRAALEAENERRRAIRTGHGNSNIKEQPVTLPLHIIRLLEVMPWDPKAQEYAFCTEEIYEWQIYNAKQQAWVATLRQFPSFFQALPTLEKTDNIVQETICHHPRSGTKKDRSWLMFLAGCETMTLHSSSNPKAPPTDGNAVLTNQGLTYLIDIKDGFPLAKDGGTWKWAGGWQIEKHAAMELGENGDDRDDNNVAAPNNRTVLECDANGWSYATEASDFLNPSALLLCQDSPGEIEERVTGEKVSFLTGSKIVERHPMPLRRIRRRKWTRRRVLIDYPFASEQTQAFMQLLAENASLKVAANNISNHLVETKMKVTQAELQSQQTEEETNNKVKQLQQEIQKHEDIIAKLKAEEKNTVMHDKHRHHYTNSVEKDTAAENDDSHSSGDGCSVEKENDGRVDKDKYSSSSTNGNKDLHHPIKKDAVQQGKDLQSLQNLLSHWVVSSTSKLKIVPNHPNENGRDDSATETPVPEDSSSAASSTEIIEEDDEGEEELTVKHLEDAAITTSKNEEDRANDSSMDHNHDSNSSQKSFDWKKLGRETIEKIKEGPAKAASSAKLPWLSPSSARKEDKQHVPHQQEKEHDMLSENEVVTTTEVTAGAS